MKKLFYIFSSFILLIVSGCKVTTTNNVMDELTHKYPNNMVFYELFIRSSFDSDNNGIGDFKGIKENISYFTDLGIEAIWLMPFNESNSYHGYDVVDYYSVEKDYGTMEEFTEMVDTFNSNNIRVFMDLVVNHTSDNHEWYKKALNNDPKYRNYYVWKNGNAFESFAGGMKDLNLQNEEVVNEVINIGNFYMDLGISGFRLDAVKHFFGAQENGIHITASTAYNYLLVNRLRNEFRKKNPNVFLISEVFDTNAVSSVYFTGSDSVFNFDLKDNIVSRVSGSNVTSYSAITNRILKEIKTIKSDYIDSVFFDNHDLDRLASILKNDPYKEERLKLASEMLLTLPGNPVIYYGTELGQEGSRAEGENLDGYGIVYDEYRRLPLKLGNDYQTSWISTNKYDSQVKSYEEQKLDSNSLYNKYVEMISVRKNNMALRFGNDFRKTNLSFVGGDSFIRCYSDENGNSQNVLVIHNLSAKTIDLSTYNFGNIIYSSNNSSNTTLNAFSTIIFDITNAKVEELEY